MSADYEAKKKILTGTVEENKCIAKGIYRMVIECPDINRWFMNARAGQFVNVYLDNSTMLLPRPISICRIEQYWLTIIYKEVGAGTKELAGRKVGSSIRFSSPLGNGYTIESPGTTAGTAMIVAGGVGVPPMLELAVRLRKQGWRVMGILGFMEESFLVDDLGETCDEIYIATENGSEGFRGNVLELIRGKGLIADLCFACGPKPMLRGLNDYCEEKGIDLKVSLEERMGCGYGACVGCSVTLKQAGDITGAELPPVKKKVCKDGPVFTAREVIWDE